LPLIKTADSGKTGLLMNPISVKRTAILFALTMLAALTVQYVFLLYGAQIAYTPLRWKANKTFWSGRKMVRVHPQWPEIPIQLPGPMDTWAGGDVKELWIYAPYKGPLTLRLGFADSHDTAPPKIGVFAMSTLVETIQVANGSGKIPGKTPIPEGLRQRVVTIPAGILDKGEPWIVIRNTSGSWVEFSGIWVTQAAPWRNMTIAGIWAILGAWLVVRSKYGHKTRRTGGIDGVSHTGNQRESPVCVIVSSLALIGATIAPSGLLSTFDGGPLSHWGELYFTAVFLPFALITGWRFLALKPVMIGLLVIFSLKLALAFTAPDAGLAIRVYDTPAELTGGEWEKTYTTIWKNGVSGLMDRPYLSARDFPLEWMNGYPDKKYGGVKWLALKLSGSARIPKGAKLSFCATGVVDGAITATDENGAKHKLALLKEPGDAAFLSENEPVGKLRIDGTLVYSSDLSGENFSLVPILTAKAGAVTDPFKANILWAGDRVPGATVLTLKVYSFMAGVVDYSMAAVAMIWLMWLLVYHAARDRHSAMFLILGVAGAIFVIFFRWIGYGGFSAMGITMPGVVLTVLMAVAVVYASKRMEPPSTDPDRLIIYVLFAIAPAVFTFFMVEWDSEIGKMRLLPSTDDWHTYQFLARKIFVDGDIFSLHEGIYKYMPFYRYVVGLWHTMFGQTTLGQDYWDVWCVVLSAAMLGSIGMRLSLAPAYALGVVWLFVFNCFTDGFVWLMGRSLQEYTALLFMIMTLWIIMRRRPVANRTALLAGLVAMASLWTRLDHVGVMLGAVLLPLGSARGGFIQSWKSIFDRVVENYRWISLYIILVTAAFLAVGTRNYLVGGIFCLDDPTDLSQISCSTIPCIAHNMKILLLAADPGKISITSVTLIPGTVMGLLALVWRPAWLCAYPVGLGVAIAGVFAPYFLFEPYGYAPRFSVHLLPLASLSIVTTLSRLSSYKSRNTMEKR